MRTALAGLVAILAHHQHPFASQYCCEPEPNPGTVPAMALP